MRLRLAVSASNIDHVYGLPAFFIVIAIDSTMASQVPKLNVENIKAKQTREGAQDPFSLDNFEEYLARYRALVKASKIRQLARPLRGSEEHVYDRTLGTYHKILDSFLSSDLMVLGGTIDSCLLKLPSDKHGREMEEVDAKTKFQSTFYDFPIIFQGRETSEGILDLARLFARYEYMKLRRSSPRFINLVISHNRDKMLQILRLTWNSPSIETYADNFVGYPKLLVRKQGRVEAQTIKPGDELSFVPIAKYCMGPSAGIDEPIAPCLLTNTKRPYGAFMEDNRFERCNKCGGQNDPLGLLYRRRRKGNSILNLLEPGVAEHILLGAYAIYVTQFSSAIKVGRTLKSRAVARLIEQSASDALVFYPIQTLEIADNLEKTLTDYLRDRKGSLKGLEVGGGMGREKKLDHAVKLSFRQRILADKEVYENIIDLVESANDPQIKCLALLEHRIVDLTENWVLPEHLVRCKIFDDFQFKQIRGQVNGYLGSLLVVADTVVDMDSLAGYVVRDDGSKYNPS